MEAICQTVSPSARFFCCPANNKSHLSATIANGYKVYEAILNAFYDEMTPITSNKPYMVNAGNHEANCTHSTAYPKSVQGV